MKGYKVVLFDLGNVLVKLRPSAFTRHLGIDPATAYRKYQGRVLEIVKRYEGGDGTTDQYLEEMSALFEGRYEKTALREGMLKVIGDPIPGMEEMVIEVASRYETGLVSNTNELHFEYCRTNLPALRHFSRFYLSYRMFSLKPSDAYYRGVISDLHVSPEAIIFVDDLEENVLGARKHGMQAIQFTSPEQLKKDFADLALF